MYPKIAPRLLPPVVAILAIMLIWIAIVHLGRLPAFILPLPQQIVASIWRLRTPLLRATVATLIVTAAGLALATVAGVGCAALIDLMPAIRRGLYPLLVLSQTIQILAVAPLIVIWFGFGFGATLFVVALFCFFPMAVATIQGLESSPRSYIQLLRSMQASPLFIWREVRLPSALPSFFAGLRLAATYSVIAATIGEWVSGAEGLGLFILRSKNALKTDQVFAGMLITSIIAIALFALVSLVERIAIPWYWDQRDGQAWSELPGRPTNNRKQYIITGGTHE